MQARTLLVVSANVGAQPSGPRKDYSVLADVLGAEVIDHRSVQVSAAARLVSKVVGTPLVQAWLAFRRRGAYDVIVTDGEHIGIPLAALLKAVRARVGHVTIGHRLSARKKRLFFRWLKVHTHVSRFALHSRRQYELAMRELGIPESRLAMLPYQVDTEFWRPQPILEERMVCSAGLEYRDYPTLMTAMDGLDVRVVIGAASHWSKRANTAAQAAQPANVEVNAFDYFALRELYARAAVVVVPLDDVDFQAGITTILEAMAMGKAVVVTHSRGQTDVVQDRRQITRGDPPRERPVSLLREVAELEGMELEPNGFYVPPGDARALRQAVLYLLEHPQARQRLGAAGRRAVEHLMTVDHYGARMHALVRQSA